MLPLGDILAPLFLVAVGGLMALGIAKLHASGAPEPVLTGLFWMLPFATVYPQTNFLYAYILLPGLIFFYCRDEEAPSAAYREDALAGMRRVGPGAVPRGLPVRPLRGDALVRIPSTGLFLMLVANAVIAWGVVRSSTQTPSFPLSKGG